MLGGKGCWTGKVGGGWGLFQQRLRSRPGEAWGGAPLTRGDAVEFPQRQVLHLVLLEAGWAGAVDGSHRGVGVRQPLHQPLHFAVAVERVAPQVPGS